MVTTIVPRIPIEIGDPAEITLLLVGCGGTGSFAALHLARLAYEARRGNGARLRLVFCDPDHVEADNIGRQNFCPAEIGAAKAMALASRYNLAFGLDIGAIVGEFDPNIVVGWYHNNWRNLLVIIGCVDNPEARRKIAQSLNGDIFTRSERHNAWWLDAGNSEHAGQVLIGNSLMAEPVIDPLLDRCVMLPLPSLQEPGIVQGSRGAGEQGEILGCAELMALNAQSLMINQAMAGWIGVYIYRLLLGRDLDVYQTWIDLRGGNVRSVAITEGALAEIAQSPIPEAWQEVGEMLEQMALGACPECGAALAEGEDILEDGGEEEMIVFCPVCDWQIRREQFDLMQEAGIDLGMWREMDNGDDPDNDGADRPAAGRRVAVAAEVVE